MHSNATTHDLTRAPDAARSTNAERPDGGMTVLTSTHKTESYIWDYLTALRSLLVLSDTPVSIVASPLLGEHSEEILREIGHDGASVADLQTAGVL